MLSVPVLDVPDRLADYVREMWTSFGERLRDLRVERGLTQEGLAERAKVHPVTISRLERGTEKPKLGTLEAIAKALEHDLRDVLACLPPELGRLPGPPQREAADTPTMRQLDAISGLLRSVPDAVRDEILRATVRIVQEHWSRENRNHEGEHHE